MTASRHHDQRTSARLKLAVQGAVQGVGFRPFIYRLATELNLKGWVNNSVQGVFAEVEGRRADAEQFLVRLDTEKPPRSSIQSLESVWLETAGYRTFEIRPSETGGNKTAMVLPDIATCPDCVAEIFDPASRRFRYPFTNCTNCGPRFSIIEAIPYDRRNTSMSSFTMCPACQAEYDDPLNRRFHAQPNACPACGPRLELLNASGDEMCRGDAALRATARAIRNGNIVAVKGIGGFHLIVAADDDNAIQTLRARKNREAKPFALMFPSVQDARAVCDVSPLEEQLLQSPEAPIVLLKRRAGDSASPVPPIGRTVAPGNPYLGIMLPGSPLHHLLMAELGIPVVATSGNLKDEPICYNETDALHRLRGIADLFLVHNRPIIRHSDDSIVRVMMGRAAMLRRARGYAPGPIELRNADPANGNGNGLSARRTVLAVGGHLKNTVALAVGSRVFISQHIGDLETEPAYRAFREIIRDFEKLYETVPRMIAADRHPDYLSTRYAEERCVSGEQRFVAVQHHVAHVLSCMADNELDPPALGVSWDGTGWGTGGVVWGGEFFSVTGATVERVAFFRPFRIPGANQAVKEPRRSAAGLLFEMLGPGGLDQLPLTLHFTPSEIGSIRTMLVREFNSPLCCSVGRLFDAVAAITGLRQVNEFEGQAAMDLEFVMEGIETREAYPLRIADGSGPAVIDWAPMIEAVLEDVRGGRGAGEISARFHNALVEIIVMVAKKSGHARVALSGGCFQNRYLLERAVTRLREEGLDPYWHQRVPPGDGGIALGQIIAARRNNS